MISVFIVERDRSASDGLRFLLNRHRDIEVVGFVSTATQAIQVLQGNTPIDVVVIDERPPDLPWHDLCQTARQIRPRIRCILHRTGADVASSSSNGSADAVVDKQIHDDELAQTIRFVANSADPG